MGQKAKANDRLGIDLRQRRERFLGSVLDGAFTLLGIVLMLTVVSRLLGIAGGRLNTPQALQGVLGALMLASGISRRWSLLLQWSRPGDGARQRAAIGWAPVLALITFLPFRLRITDLKAYAGRVSEGSLVEWLSFLFLLLAGVLLLLSGRRERQRPAAFTATVLGAGSLLIAMEEMSWGQIIFNWRSPEIFKQANVQGETNLHNLAPIHGSTWAIAAAVFCLLTLLSLLRWWLERRRPIRPHTSADALLPEGCLLAYFALAAVIYIGVAIERGGTDVPILITREQEVLECLFALGVLLHAGRLYLRWGES